MSKHKRTHLTKGISKRLKLGEHNHEYIQNDRGLTSYGSNQSMKMGYLGTSDVDMKPSQFDYPKYKTDIVSKL